MWKKLPYWAKGGIIGASIVILLAILNLFVSSNDTSVILYPVIYAYLAFIGLSLGVFTSLLSGHFGISWNTFYVQCSNFMCPANITGVLISAVIWFLIGAIIGWIVGKVKSRKQNNLVS